MRDPVHRHVPGTGSGGATGYARSVPPFAHIACFVDESEAALRGFEEARRLSGEGTRLSLVHVVAPVPWPVAAGSVFGGVLNDPLAMRNAAEEWLTALADEVPGAEAVLLDGHPAEEAVTFLTESGCDLAVAASHAGRVSRTLLGSFALFLAHHSPCPVLLVPPPPAED